MIKWPRYVGIQTQRICDETQRKKCRITGLCQREGYLNDVTILCGLEFLYCSQFL
jgi:hypothetical protein